MAKEDILQDNRIEDVRWLCSLSESELDMLIILKTLVFRRTEVIGHPALAKQFNLKMLRALGFIFMEHLREQLTESSAVPALDKYLDKCNFLKCELDQQHFGTMSIEDLRTYVDASRRKRVVEMFSEDEPPPAQKKKN